MTPGKNLTPQVGVGGVTQRRYPLCWALKDVQEPRTAKVWPGGQSSRASPRKRSSLLLSTERSSHLPRVTQHGSNGARILIQISSAQSKTKPSAAWAALRPVTRPSCKLALEALEGSQARHTVRGRCPLHLLTGLVH